MDDKATHARSSGKTTTQASIVWELKIGTLAVRCRRVSESEFATEIRTARGWDLVRTSGTPAERLRMLTMLGAYLEVITHAAETATPKP